MASAKRGPKKTETVFVFASGCETVVKDIAKAAGINHRDALVRIEALGYVRKYERKPVREPRRAAIQH